MFVCLNLLSGTIKTEKITVPTDQVVDSAAKLIGTSKTLTFHVKELNSVMTAPEGSFLKQLSKKDIFVVDGFNSLVQIKAIGIDNFVFFAEKARAIYFLTILSQHAGDSVVFSKENNYYELLGAFPMRASLDKERKRLLNSR